MAMGLKPSKHQHLQAFSLGKFCISKEVSSLLLGYLLGSRVLETQWETGTGGGITPLSERRPVLLPSFLVKGLIHTPSTLLCG